MFTAKKIIPAKTPQQIKTISDLAFEIWKEYYTQMIGEAQVQYMLNRFQSVYAIAEQIKNQNYLYYLIFDNNNPVGYFTVQPRGFTHELFISKFYIQSSQRGKGLGKKAFEFIEKIANHRHLSRISLTVHKHNLNSLRIYEHLGFQNKGPIVQDIGNGFVMDDFLMEKTLF